MNDRAGHPESVSAYCQELGCTRPDGHEGGHGRFGEAPTEAPEGPDEWGPDGGIPFGKCKACGTSLKLVGSNPASLQCPKCPDSEQWQDPEGLVERLEGLDVPNHLNAHRSKHDRKLVSDWRSLKDALLAHLQRPEPVEERLVVHCRRLLMNGSYVDAIKEYRAETGLPLRPAKKAVDKIRAEMRGRLHEDPEDFASTIPTTVPEACPACDDDGGECRLCGAEGPEGLVERAPNDCQIIARHALAIAAEELDWGLYPEIGEHDWRRVCEIAQEIADSPSREAYDAAYARLESRAGQGADLGRAIMGEDE